MSTSKQPFFPTAPWLIIVNIGLLLIVAGTAMPLFHLTGLWVKVIFSIGAAATLLGRILSPSTKGLPLRARRLYRMEAWAGVIFCIGAFFMWYTPERMDWLAFTLAGAVIQIYTSLAIPKALAEQSKEK